MAAADAAALFDEWELHVAPDITPYQIAGGKGKQTLANMWASPLRLEHDLEDADVGNSVVAWLDNAQPGNGVSHTHSSPPSLSQLQGHTLKAQHMLLFSIQPPQANPSITFDFYIAVPWKGFYSTPYVFSVVKSYRLVRCPVWCRESGGGGWDGTLSRVHSLLCSP